MPSVFLYFTGLLTHLWRNKKLFIWESRNKTERRLRVLKTFFPRLRKTTSGEIFFIKITENITTFSLKPTTGNFKSPSSDQCLFLANHRLTQCWHNSHQCRQSKFKVKLIQILVLNFYLNYLLEHLLENQINFFLNSNTVISGV